MKWLSLLARWRESLRGKTSATHGKEVAPDKLRADCHLFVDFENIQKFDLSVLPKSFSVTIVVGRAQNSIPFALIQGAQRSGIKVAWLKLESAGNNALDFYIAYYLGSLLAQRLTTQCFILSKDTGFDPLVIHLQKEGLNCRRIDCLSKLQVGSGLLTKPTVTAASGGGKKATSAAIKPDYERVLRLLSKAEKGRPARRKTLLNHIAGLHQKRLKPEELEQIMERLFAEGKVTESNGVLIYSL